MRAVGLGATKLESADSLRLRNGGVGRSRSKGASEESKSDHVT